MNRILFIIMAGAIAIALLSINLSAKPILIEDTVKKLSLSQKIEILEDKNASIKFKDLMGDKEAAPFESSAAEIPNYGFTKSAYWIKFTLKNNSTLPRELLLETGFPLLDLINFYNTDLINNKIQWQHTQTGRLIPFKERKLNNRNFVFRLNFTPHEEKRCLMRIKTDDGMIFPLTIWEKASFLAKSHLELLFFGIYYGIIIVMFFYNLFLFLSTRDRSYFYYILYIGSFGMFQAAMNGVAYQYLWPGHSWWAIHANPFFIALSVFFGLVFSINFLDTSFNAPFLHKILKSLAVLSLMLIPGALILDYSFTIISGQILPLLCIFTVIPAAIVSRLRGYRPARFYLIAWSMFLFGVVLSTLRVMGILPHNVITEHGLQIGSGIEAILLALALADRIKIMEKEKNEAQAKMIEARTREIANLKKIQKEIEEANRRISLSEEKYRLLVEGSGDIIFSLSQDWNFITANRSIQKQLSINPDTVHTKNFLDIIYHNEKTGPVIKNLVQEKLEAFMQSDKPVEFKTDFTSSISIEPKEMNVKLEHINIEGKNEILGKASSVIEDNLLKFFDRETQTYRIPNFLITADEMTQRLTRNLKRYADVKDISLIRIALREMIINSIEHGNLDISFKEKTRLLEDGEYFEFLAEKQQNPSYGNRRVSIDYSLDENSATYTIRDEGNGFDHSKYTENEQPPEEAIQHGRGITLAKNIFDSISFNEKGNEVTLIKKFK